MTKNLLSALARRRRKFENNVLKFNFDVRLTHLFESEKQYLIDV